MRKAIIISILALIGLVGVLYYKCAKYEVENDRLTQNQRALMEQATYYQTEAGKNAATVERLTLSKNELERNYSDICRVADELGVKVKRLQAAATTATKTEVKVITQVRDSIVYVNGAVDSFKVFNWRDDWVSVDGNLRGDSVSLNVESSDTIHQVIHRVPHKFWFIKWGTKAIRQEVMSSNPHTKITYTEYIELK